MPPIKINHAETLAIVICQESCVRQGVKKICIHTDSAYIADIYNNKLIDLITKGKFQIYENHENFKMIPDHLDTIRVK